MQRILRRKRCAFSLLVPKSQADFEAAPTDISLHFKMEKSSVVLESDLIQEAPLLTVYLTSRESQSLEKQGDRSFDDANLRQKVQT